MRRPLILAQALVAALLMAGTCLSFQLPFPGDPTNNPWTPPGFPTDLDDLNPAKIRDAAESAQKQLAELGIEVTIPEKLWDDLDEVLKQFEESPMLKKLIALGQSPLMDPEVGHIEKVGTGYPGEPVYFVNGILNTFDDAVASAHKLATAVRRPVYLLWNPTAGLEADLEESYHDRQWPLELVDGNFSQPNHTTRLVARLLYDSDGKLSIVGHSQGCIIIRNAMLTISFFGKDKTVREKLACAFAGAALHKNEIWPQPARSRFFVNKDDLVAKTIGLQYTGKLSNLSLRQHEFKNYVDLIEGKEEDCLWPTVRPDSILRTVGRLEATSGESSVGGAIAADGKHLYWWDRRPSYQALRRAELKEDGTLGTSMPVEAPNDSSIRQGHGVAIDHGWLYYWDDRRQRKSLRRVKLASDGQLEGNTQEVERPKSSIDAAKGLAIVDGTLFYFDHRSNHQCLCRAKIMRDGTLDTSERVEKPKESSIGGCLTAADGYLYFFDTRKVPHLKRAKIQPDGMLGNSETVEVPPSSIDETKGFAIAGKRAYWFDTRYDCLVMGRFVE